jgi:Bacterial mobilisation protein (MobC)
MSDRKEARRQRRVPGGSPHRINVRTTAETYARLVVGAAAARLSLPRYLIESALRRSSGGWSLREQRWWAERLDVVETRLIRIGTNLNQMAAAANATGELPDALAGALRYLQATLDRHREILKAIDPADRSRR